MAISAKSVHLFKYCINKNKKRVLMERKESNQMFVISNIKQWRKEMRACHALSLFAIEENKRHTSFPQLSSFKGNN